MPSLYRAKRSIHLRVFYSAHQSIATFTGMTSKWECNVQNNRAYQYDMICDEIGGKRIRIIV